MLHPDHTTREPHLRCNQCAAEAGLPEADFANRALYPSQLIWVHCKGCGVTLVDQLGNCASTTCIKRHFSPRDKEGLPFVIANTPAQRFLTLSLAITGSLSFLVGVAVGMAVWGG